MLEEVSLKLLVNTDTNKVVFAEAGKDFVDVLCSFLTLPLGTIVRLLQNDNTNMKPVKIGCLDSLYQSVENLNVDCLNTRTCKKMLLYSRNSSEEYCNTLKLNIDDTTDPTRDFFMCSNLADCKYSLLSSFRNQRCECGSLLGRPVLVKSDQVYNGFVKDGPVFIVTDDLSVFPNSVDTVFDLLKTLGIPCTHSLKEMFVNITYMQVLDLLKYSLLSKSSLTNLFLRKEPVLEETSFSTYDVPNNCRNRIKLKLFLREKDNEILFAQGEEDFADFVFSFLTFPLGGVVRMLGGNSSLGSIDSLYKTILDLDGYKYLVSSEVKNRLVDPCIAPQFKLSKQILQIYEPPASSYYCYRQRSFRESIIHD
ncbi:uncharacterized protein LOC127127521 isoform X1 [Lathyrus oleraceus]|uniref:DUF674 family protein n=2 Tax=Pisum sativum TaxID=3888 RepID=A0A9D4Y0C9_PEA|nr:uncharacterized protein LOC127127521 isoform X1 [Pisum sativum]KAI5429663.1 hypothetical protein KIW84_034290 [Pisum sativum]